MVGCLKGRAQDWGGGLTCANLSRHLLPPQTGAFGNKDLRELQNLISDEKILLQSSSRISGALATTSTSLAAWGASEGPDLADICQRASEMLALVSTGFEVFSAREVEIRGLLKSVRTNEEELDELKKRRRAVGNRSESEEKKLVKMSSEVRLPPPPSLHLCP